MKHQAPEDYENYLEKGKKVFDTLGTPFSIQFSDLGIILVLSGFILAKIVWLQANKTLNIILDFRLRQLTKNLRIDRGESITEIRNKRDLSSFNASAQLFAKLKLSVYQISTKFTYNAIYNIRNKQSIWTHLPKRKLYKPQNHYIANLQSCEILLNSINLHVLCAEGERSLLPIPFLPPKKKFLQ